MNKKVILEIDDTGNVVDKTGYILCNVMAVKIASFEEESKASDKTVELVKLGVSVDEIIKLKNMELI